MNTIEKFVAKGVKFHANGLYTESIVAYNKARDIAYRLTNNKNLFDLLNRNIGLSYFELKQYELALNSFNAVATPSDQLEYEKALALFHLKRVEEAIPLYRYRYYRQDTFPPIPLPFVEITVKVDRLNGKKVLILNEEGLGDELMYMRAVKRISDVVKSASIQVYPELKALLEANIKLPNISFFSDRILKQRFIDQFDIWTSTGTIWSWFPNESPLELESYQPKIDMPAGNNIAFVYAPNVKSKNFKSRKISEQFFKRLSQQGNNLHSLQYGETIPFAKNYQLNDFTTTLNIIESVDEVLTIDTSVAHLLANSAARHKIKCALVYRNYLDWRWSNNFYNLPVRNIII